MKFNIICSFRGFCGEKAVIGQESTARLVNYYIDIYKDLMDSQGLVMSMECGLDDNGQIWIREVNHLYPEE